MKLKIAFILYTEALEFDDRIRKEALSLLKLGNVEIKIFTILGSNKASEGITTYGVPFKAFSLKTRRIFQSATMLSLKTIEFYMAVQRELKEFDVLWPHNVQSFMFPLFSRKKRIVWDLHEVPFEFEGNVLKRKLFSYLERKCNFLIHANQYRVDYLASKNLVKCPQKHFVLRNFPDTEFIKSDISDPEWIKFSMWLDNSEYVYLQGLKQAMRYPEQVVEAIMQTDGLKAVIVGGFEETAKRNLTVKYGADLNKKLYFRGKVNQLLTPSYIHESKFSIIVYQADYDANHLFCEANRLYQTIIFEKPVVVGCNPPMADLVKQYGFGVAMNTDGSNTNDIIHAIRSLNNNLDYYIKNIKSNKHLILWERQEIVLLNIINSLM